MAGPNYVRKLAVTRAPIHARHAHAHAQMNTFRDALYLLPLRKRWLGSPVHSDLHCHRPGRYDHHCQGLCVELFVSAAAMLVANPCISFGFVIDLECVCSPRSSSSSGKCEQCTPPHLPDHTCKRAFARAGRCGVSRADVGDA